MFASELDIFTHCFSPKDAEEIQDGILIKRVENLPCQNSSVIEVLGYDQANCIFYVQLLNGKTYRYFDTPLSLWQRFITTTGSIGRLYNQQIKGTFKGGQVPKLV
ncbi:MAG: KTSC domain-containing protein [Cyanobacteria bacterium P01_G01_bin.49]